MMRNLRYLSAKLFFILMGLPVNKYRKEVQDMWTLSEVERLENLEAVLRKNRPMSSVCEELKSISQLYDSPSLSKRALNNQYSNMVDSVSRRFYRHTAGTTGNSTNIFLTRIELGKMLGVRDYCFRHYGVKLGQREARLWGRPESGIKSRLKNFVMNRRVFHPVGSEARDEVVALLKWRPDYLYGYASLLLEAAQILTSMDLEFEPPKCVVCTAESILPSQKAYISKAFKAPLAEEYGSTEFDVIAFECTEGHRHLVNPWVLVEGSEDKGCLVTDVSRTSQSLIRYELGDYVNLEFSDCTLLGGAEVIGQLEGRSINRFAYLSKNEKFHALEFARAVDRYQSMSGEVFEFTVYQYQYGCFVLETSTRPGKGLPDLTDFVSEYIYKVVGKKVDITANIKNKFSEISGKKGYFIQAMEPDHVS